MCGRFTHLLNWQQLHRLLGLATPPFEFRERYNIAPSQDAPVARAEGNGGRRLDVMRWGLVPAWAKDLSIGNRTINARSETAATSPAFRAAVRSRRCIVPVSGFFEWQRIEGSTRKQAWYITPADDEGLAFAGLWESWEDPAQRGEPGRGPLLTFTVLTTTANAAMRPIHDRMPVILAREQFGAWLDPQSTDPAAIAPMLAPWPPERLRLIRVSSWVNSPAHEDARCIAPDVAPPAGEPGLFGA